MTGGPVRVEPFTDDQIDEKAVAAFIAALHDSSFVRQSCGGAVVERAGTQWLTLSRRAHEAIARRLLGLSNASVVVMRRAVLQEDEGRDTLVQKFHSRSEAEAWIRDQKGMYFGPGDYRIIG